MFHVKSQAKANRFMLLESILELGTKLVEAEAHWPCLDDAITSNMVWDLLRWFSPEVLYLVTLTNCWKPNSPCVCSLYQSFGVVKVWNMKKMADIYQQDSFKRSCSGTGRLDILLSNQSGICWTTLRCQENCWTHAVFEWDKWSYWSFSENSGPGSFNLRWTLSWISCALKRCESFDSVKDLIWNRPAFKTIR